MKNFQNDSEVSAYIKQINNPFILTMLSETGDFSELKTIHNNIIEKNKNPQSIDDILDSLTKWIKISTKNEKLLQKHFPKKYDDENPLNNQHKLRTIDDEFFLVSETNTKNRDKHSKFDVKFRIIEIFILMLLFFIENLILKFEKKYL